MGCGSSKQPPQETTKPLYTPPTDFPTPKLLADCQRELARLDIDVGQEVDQDGDPLPFPPKRSKSDIFDRNNLSEVRQHALQAPTDLSRKSLPEIVQYFRRGQNDQLQQLYCAFCWLVYTSRALHRCPLEPTPPKPSLLYRLVLAHAGYVQYNDIFLDFCREMGITARKVEGKVKHIKDNLVSSEEGTWLIVLLNATWRFLDLDFAIATLKRKHSINKGKPESKKQSSTLDIPFHRDTEFYFLCDPEQFIYSHYPNDAAWQLLARPVTYEEFKVMAHITEGFFTLGFWDIADPRGILESTGGRTKLTLSLPDSNYITTSSTLAKIAGEKVLQQTKGETLKKLVEITNTSENRKNIEINLIDIGRYILKIFAQDLDPKATPQAVDIIGVWFIDCQQPLHVWDVNPSAEVTELLPGASLKLFGIEYKTLSIPEGMHHMFFKCNKEMYAFKYSLESPKSSQSQMNKFLVHYTVPNEGSGVIFQCPIRERCILNVFIRASSKHRQFKLVCSLPCSRSEILVNHTLFYKDYNSRIGHLVDKTENSTETTTALKPVSHSSPFIVSTDGQPIKIVFESPTVYQLLFQYRVHSAVSVDDVSDYVWYNIQVEESGKATTTITARLPQVGIYTLSVFTPFVWRKSDTYREVYRCLILAESHENNCVPYPEILPGWSPEYVLDSPLNFFVDEQEELEFSLTLKDADSVNVCHARSSLYQNLTLLDNGVFKGRVKSLNGGNHLTVKAHLQNRPQEVQLLKYIVLTKDDWIALQEQHQKTEETIKDKQNHLKQIQDQEKAQVEAYQKNREEKERKLSEEFQEEKAALIEREKQWQKEFEEKFSEESNRIERKNLEDLTENEEAKEVKREIQKILQAQMSDSDLRKRLYKGMSEEILRQRLRKAIMTRDRNELQRAVDDYYNSQLPTKGVRDLLVAERMLEIASLRDDLVDATWRKDIPKAIELLHIIRNKNYQDTLEKEVTEAENMIQSMQKVNSYKEDILNMDKRMMSELRSYQRPPEGVHHVMKAVFLLLGEDEATTTEWAVCATMCNPYGMQGLNRRLQALEIERLHPEIVARAKQLLLAFKVQQVQRVSSGAAIFFMWAMSCIDEYEETGSEKSDSFLNTVQPADVGRQKELLGKIPLQFSQPYQRSEWLKTSARSSTQSNQDSVLLSTRSYQTPEYSERLTKPQQAVMPRQKYKSKFAFQNSEVPELQEDF